VKSASLAHFFESRNSQGLVGSLLSALAAVRLAIREQAAGLPAIGLAENGDVEGASQLLTQTSRKKP
jgi:hypothetical protein